MGCDVPHAAGFITYYLDRRSQLDPLPRLREAEPDAQKNDIAVRIEPVVVNRRQLSVSDDLRERWEIPHK